MGLKNDTWIRKMAMEQKMIEPFVDGQVREGVISFGLSSYGYDIRVTDEFKIFTNVHSAVVDPKHFQPDSFVDFKGEVCIIPPNSFVLARTVEYFRIPRQVLTMCIGKCVTGDTRVVDAATGAYRPISEMAQLRQTVGLDGWSMTTLPVSDFIPNGIKPVYELTTRTGLKIQATVNHPFRQLNGWTPLGQLKPGDRIAAARHIPIFGKTPLPDWEAALLGLMIAEGHYRTPVNNPTFTTADPTLVQLLEKCVVEGWQGEISFSSKAGYRLVNSRKKGHQLETNRATLWLQKYGLNVNSTKKFVPQAIFKAPKETVVTFLQALFTGNGSIFATDDKILLEYFSSSRRLIEDIHHLLLRFGIGSMIVEKAAFVGSELYRIQISDQEMIHRFASEIGFWPGSEKQRRLEEELLPLLAGQPTGADNDFDTLPGEGWELLDQTARQNKHTLRALGLTPTPPEQSLSYSDATIIAEATQDPVLDALVHDGPIWDVIESIEYIGERPVYDLSVPGAHNFIANDLVLHNSTYARCGLIVNVTPFEPEWEGFVTLEISNTTPLPAKVYAWEGIAQVLFFEGDDPCEISYADRKGKYQAQQNIVLPRI